MFDRVMFEKICGLTCTYDELKCFNSKIDEKEFDVDNSFEKYYSLDVILKCMDHTERNIKLRILPGRQGNTCKDLRGA